MPCRRDVKRPQFWNNHALRRMAPPHNHLTLRQGNAFLAACHLWSRSPRVTYRLWIRAGFQGRMQLAQYKVQCTTRAQERSASSTLIRLVHLLTAGLRVNAAAAKGKRSADICSQVLAAVLLPSVRSAVTHAASLCCGSLLSLSWHMLALSLNPNNVYPTHCTRFNSFSTG